MDELEISGKRYISTRRAAKDNKYHSDYIGQLIRAGKVEGQKVGRSWYVAADSLAEYLGKEGSSKPQSVREHAAAAVAQPKVTGHEQGFEAAEEADEKIEIETPEETVEEPEQVPVVAAVEEKIIKEDEEEYRIPVSIKRRVEIKKEAPVRASRSALRYIADDGPLYPRVEPRGAHVQVMPRFAQEVSEVEPEPVEYAQEEEPQILHKPQRAMPASFNWTARTGILVAVAAATLGVVAGASAFVSSTMTVQGQSASVSYSVSGVR